MVSIQSIWQEEAQFVMIWDQAPIIAPPNGTMLANGSPSARAPTSPTVAESLLVSMALEIIRHYQTRLYKKEKEQQRARLSVCMYLYGPGRMINE